MRIPDFFQRTYRGDTEPATDDLECPECAFVTTFEHSSLPPVGEELDCAGCGLPSRIPSLPSQAGQADPIEPHNDIERN